MDSRAGRPLIISASRRTDLPGFHAVKCAERIRLRIDRLKTRRLLGVVFWTKHLKPFLPNGHLRRLITHEIDNPIVNLTITGLGSTDLEPGAPAAIDALNDLPKLVDAFHGDPWRIRWRYDPIIFDRSNLSDFKRIAKTVSKLGVNTCTFSFPSYRSLKGDLTSQFERAGIAKWPDRKKTEFLHEMSLVAGDLGIELLSCAQPENLTAHPAVKPAQCIPVTMIERGCPDITSSLLPKDRSQRKHCNCIESEDVGDYELDRCGGGCVYCYSKAGGPFQPIGENGSSH